MDEFVGPADDSGGFCLKVAEVGEECAFECVWVGEDGGVVVGVVETECCCGGFGGCVADDDDSAVGRRRGEVVLRCTCEEHGGDGSSDGLCRIDHC